MSLNNTAAVILISIWALGVGMWIYLWITDERPYDHGPSEAHYDEIGVSVTRHPVGISPHPTIVPLRTYSADPRNPSGTFSDHTPFALRNAAASARQQLRDDPMNGIIYIVGLIVVVLAVLSFLGLH